MACSQSEYSKTSVTNIVPNVTAYGLPVSSSKRFFISDNPESIYSSDFNNSVITLWHDTVTGLSTVRYRVFFWHFNPTAANGGIGSTIKVGLTLGNGSTGTTADSYKISNMKMAVSVTPNFLELGKCAAAALLGDTLDSTTPTTSSIASNTIGVLKEWTVPVGQLVGGVVEFDVTNTTSTRGLVYKLRCVAANTSTGSLNSWQGAPVAKHGSHPRGSWNFSDIQGSTSSSAVVPFEYSVGDAAKSISVSNGTNDNIMSAATSYSPSEANSNAGHYGVIYLATFRFRNTTPTDKIVRISLVGRGGAYLGAARAANVTKKVPILSKQTTAATQESVTVIDVLVPKMAVGTYMDYPIKISTGGGGSTAAALVLTTV